MGGSAQCGCLLIKSRVLMWLFCVINQQEERMSLLRVAPTYLVFWASAHTEYIKIHLHLAGKSVVIREA